MVFGKDENKFNTILYRFKVFFNLESLRMDICLLDSWTLSMHLENKCFSERLTKSLVCGINFVAVHPKHYRSGHFC